MFFNKKLLISWYVSQNPEFLDFPARTTKAIARELRSFAVRNICWLFSNCDSEAGEINQICSEFLI